MWKQLNNLNSNQIFISSSFWFNLLPSLNAFLSIVCEPLNCVLFFWWKWSTNSPIFLSHFCFVHLNTVVFLCYSLREFRWILCMKSIQIHSVRSMKMFNFDGIVITVLYTSNYRKSEEKQTKKCLFIESIYLQKRRFQLYGKSFAGWM